MLFSSRGHSRDPLRQHNPRRRQLQGTPASFLPPSLLLFLFLLFFLVFIFYFLFCVQFYAFFRLCLLSGLRVSSFPSFLSNLSSTTLSSPVPTSQYFCPIFRYFSFNYYFILYLFHILIWDPRSRIMADELFPNSIL